ncbi:winged helix-turn-helix domain-containing protein [Rhizobium sp. TH2]|uniref:winged helix-turn-helix domain-containing protein n=1 Tax=Rhizobium sp. TH2 TaxID=2775403 RepID=UPI0021580697|nr:winged helix-turn-helix domain-containing protein [Rhizobium sp. TH2]UVC10390.1 winged helix-turn-helix domain-containing protein [Rhizobium sp. TH2]
MADDPIHFGPFTFDPGRMTVARGGEVSQLGNRAALLLKCLAEAGGGTVSKEALMNAAWPGVAVEEGNLTVQIAGMRKLLGQDGEGRDWIVTVPRAGYRLLAAPAADRVPEPGPRMPVLAVLPFRNLSRDADADYFADGVVADIITALSRFRSFRVISRNTVFARRSHDADIRQAAADLGADYLVEGDIRRAGERLRISVRLVPGHDGFTLWADRFDGTLEDVFAFQDQITEAVASRLRPALEQAETTRSLRDRPKSFAAYDVYLRALWLIGEESAVANVEAHALLLQALELEPNNPNVLAHAVWALEHRNAMGWPPIGNDDIGRCLDYARRALEHCAGDPRIMAPCGMALVQTGKDYVGGMQVIEAAAAANPNDLYVMCVLGVSTLHCGDLDEAQLHLERALRLAPQDPDRRFAMTGIAHIAVIRGDYEQALYWAGRSLSVNAHFDATYWMLISANAYLGRMEEAKLYLDRLREIAPGVSLARIKAGQPARYPERIDTVLEGLRLAGLQ